MSRNLTEVDYEYNIEKTNTIGTMFPRKLRFNWFNQNIRRLSAIEEILSTIDKLESKRGIKSVKNYSNNWKWIYEESQVVFVINRGT